MNPEAMTLKCSAETHDHAMLDAQVKRLNSDDSITAGLPLLGLDPFSAYAPSGSSIPVPCPCRPSAMHKICSVSMYKCHMTGFPLLHIPQSASVLCGCTWHWQDSLWGLLLTWRDCRSSLKRQSEGSGSIIGLGACTGFLATSHTRRLLPPGPPLSHSTDVSQLQQQEILVQKNGGRALQQACDV